MIIYAKLGFVSSYNDNMIYIDTGHHSRRSCDRRHCACLVNLTKVSTLYSSVHGERTHGDYGDGAVIIWVFARSIPLVDQAYLSLFKIIILNILLKGQVYNKT